MSRVVAAAVVFVVAWFVLVPGLRPILTDPDAQTAAGPIVVPEDVYNPVLEGEETPDGYVQVLGRDIIYPVYNPTFKAGDEIEWEDDTLVIGVASDDEAKAYPVSFLGHREMVNDRIGGTPILVSW